MSRGTILGVEIASPEQQRKTALVILGVFVALTLGVVGAFTGPRLYTHFSYVDTPGTVTGLEYKCHYVINRFNKRGPANVTDVIDCESAYRAAAEVDHAMGEVRPVTIVHVDYPLDDGSRLSSWFDVPGEAAVDLAVGDAISLQYHPEHPHRVQRRAVNPFALTHAGRYGVKWQAALQAVPGTPPEAQAPSEPQAEPAPVAQPAVPDTRTTAQKTGSLIGRTLAWIVVILVPYGIYRIILWLWRRLRSGGVPAASASPPRRTGRPANVSADQLARVTRSRSTSSRPS